MPSGGVHPIRRRTVSYSRIVNDVIAAVDEIQAAGVSVEVIDLRTIEPWDRETVFASVAKTGRCCVVHEAVMKYGVGAEIASVVSETQFDNLIKLVARLGAPYAPVPFSKPLESSYAPSARQIAEKVIALAR